MVRTALAPVTPSPLVPANANAVTPPPVPRLRNHQSHDAGTAVCNKENVVANVLTQELPVKNSFIHFEAPAKQRRNRKSEPWGQKIAAFEEKGDTTPNIPQTPESFSPRVAMQIGDASGRSISIYQALFSGSSAPAAVPRHSPSPHCVLRIFDHLPQTPSSPAQLPPRQLSFSGSSPMQCPLMRLQ
eukprot:TRINITY_DN2941_c0_g1_i1.p1 TRINITY_DN2941_c0_g1~~TRINITY_DN2941_c0_g1_i1.p1  ORF type:complete len:186 (+),score=21.76 TRINITY_DN2941_c0_g1_i1:79-636(+)